MFVAYVIVSSKLHYLLELERNKPFMIILSQETREMVLFSPWWCNIETWPNWTISRGVSLKIIIDCVFTNFNKWDTLEHTMALFLTNCMSTNILNLGTAFCKTVCNLAVLIWLKICFTIFFYLHCAAINSYTTFYFRSNICFEL